MLAPSEVVQRGVREEQWWVKLPSVTVEEEEVKWQAVVLDGEGVT
jgi:hypothetical protein